MPHKIPVNIITGFLGVGKTTAIQHLLANKPAGEKWAVLVNEFGQIGIDQTAFEEDEGVTIKELPGGCICCSLGLPLTMSLVMLIRRAQPDRLLIEPTGIGHPSGIIDTLIKEPFNDTLDLRATLCLVDPRSLDQPKVMEHETFQDQINLADVLILNKTDLADEASITRMEQKSTELFPSKQAVVRAVQGGFDPALLDCTGTGYSARFPSQHNETHAHSHEHNKQPDAEPLPGTPQRTGGQGFGRYTCSWLFHRDDHFDLDLISHWCRELKGLERIKGALRINQNWVLLNQVGGEQVVSPLAWRRDSRLELISTEPLDDAALEQSLLACLQSGEESEVAWPG